MPPYNKSTLARGLGKREKLPVGWPWRLLIFTLILLGAAICGYLGMSLGYEPYLNSRIRNLDDKITGLTQTIGEEEQENLTFFYSQLVNIEDLLASHSNPSKTLEFLETNTHSQVYYSILNFSIVRRSLTLEGSASDYGVLTQQIKLFQEAPEVERLFLRESHLLDNGTIQFSMELILKTDFLKQS